MCDQQCRILGWPKFSGLIQISHSEASKEGKGKSINGRAKVGLEHESALLLVSRVDSGVELRVSSSRPSSSGSCAASNPDWFKNRARPASAAGSLGRNKLQKGIWSEEVETFNPHRPVSPIATYLFDGQFFCHLIPFRKLWKGIKIFNECRCVTVLKIRTEF